MNWKDYLHFTQGEKKAILTLLILIIVSGGIYVFTSRSKCHPQVAESHEFEKFEQELERETNSFSKNNQDTSDQFPRTRYIRQEKLKQGETVELNKADTTELKKIPGIGSAFANRIVKYRTLLGGYHTLEQLKEVWGMDDYLYQDIIPYITLERTLKKMRINQISFEELRKHPYIDYKQAQIICDLRDRKGNIESINRLILLDEFSEKDIKRLKPYIAFN